MSFETALSQEIRYPATSLESVRGCGEQSAEFLLTHRSIIKRTALNDTKQWVNLLWHDQSCATHASKHVATVERIISRCIAECSRLFASG